MSGLQVASPAPTQTSMGNAVPDRRAIQTAAKLYDAMMGGAFGWGADADAMHAALDHQGPEQLDQIRAAYRDHYRRDLDADVSLELSGTDLERARALLRSDQTMADAIRLHQATREGYWVDPDEIFTTLEGLDPEALDQVRRAYSTRFGRDLDIVVQGAVYGDELVRARALLDGDRARAEAARIHQAIDGPGTTEAEVYASLEETPVEPRAVEVAYRSMYGAELRTEVLGDLGEGERERALGALDGDRGLAIAGRIRAAMVGPGTTEAEIDAALEGESDAVRRAAAEAYQAQYQQSLTQGLAEELEGTDLERALALEQRGKLSTAEAVYFAITGLGTDEDALKAALHGQSAADLALAERDYRARYGGDLEEDALGEVGGRDHLEVQLGLQGAPASPEAELARLQARHDYERGSVVSNLIVDRFTDQGRIFDQDRARAEAAFAGANADGVIDPAERAHLAKLDTYGATSVETYRNGKDALAEAGATAATTVVAVGVAIGTGGSAAPLEATLYASLAGAATRPATISLIEGDLDPGRILVDTVQGGAEGGLSALSGVAGGKVANAALRVSAGGSLLGDGAAKLELGAALAARKRVEAELGVRLAHGAVAGGVDGTLGGASGAGLVTALDDHTWDQGVGPGLERVATASALGAAAGLGTGVVSGGFASRNQTDLADPLFHPQLRERGRAERVWAEIEGAEDSRFVAMGQDHLAKLGQLEDLLPLIRHVDGLDLVQLDHHLTALQIEGPAREMVIDRMTQIADDPRIKGLDDWARVLLRPEDLSKAKELRENLYNDLGELAVARRLADQLPGDVQIQIGRDVVPPLREGTWDELEKTFDIAVYAQDAETYVEVKTLQGRFTKEEQLSGAVSQAAEKVLPTTPGHREAAVVVDLQPGPTTKSPYPSMEANGTVAVLRHGKVETSNVFDAYVTILNGNHPRKAKAPANANALDAITFFRKDGAPLYRATRDPESNRWTGTRL